MSARFPAWSSCLALCLLSLASTALNAQAAPTEQFIVSDFATAEVHTLNVSDHAETSVVKTGGSPAYVVVAPGGRIAYAANLNSNYVSVLDFTLNPAAEIARIQNVRARPITLSADGTRLYAFTVNTDELVVVDTSSLQVIQRIQLGIEADPTDVDPRGVVVIGSHAFLQARSLAGNSMPVFAVDLNTSAVTPIAGTATASTRGGNTLAATPDGKFVVSARLFPHSIFIIDSQTNTVVADVALSAPPSAVATPPNSTSPDGVMGYVVSGGAVQTVQAIDLRPTLGGAANPGFASLSGGLALPFPPGSSFIKTGITADGSQLFIDTTSTTSPANVAVVDTASLSLLSSFRAGVNVQGMTVAFVQTQPPATAPQVTDVNSNQTVKGVLVNSSAATISVTGAGFSPDVQVRVGSLPAVAPTSSTGSTVQVPVPQAAAGQTAQIIATNLNAGSPVSNQLQSGILRGQFVIAGPPTFQPANQVLTGNFADGSLSLLNVATNASASSAVPGVFLPSTIAISPDGNRAYIGSWFAGGIGVFNLVTNQLESPIALNSVSSPAFSSSIAMIPNPATGIPGSGDPVAFTIAQPENGDGTNDEVLDVIDVQPTTPTGANPAFNTIVGTISAGLSDGNFGLGNIAATPDGKYVYEDTADANGNGLLVIFDVLHNSATSIPKSSLGTPALVPIGTFWMLVSPDSKSLLLSVSDGSIRVFDISNPLAPSFVTNITGTPTPAFSSIQFDSWQILGNQLFAYASAQNVIQVFNFDRTAPATLGHLVVSYSIPGIVSPNNTSSSEFAITPDGKLLYAELTNEDAVAAIDVARLLGGDPNPLLTKLSTGLAPQLLAIRPGTPTPASTAANPIVTVQPIQQLTVSLSGASGGATTVATTNTTPVSAPAGFQLGPIPVYYEISSTSSFSDAVVCIHYDPTQVPSPESSLQLAHFDSTINSTTGQPIGWTNVTIPGSPDTSTHTICGQVSSFSPFVIGIASVNLQFKSLLDDISSLPRATTPEETMRSLRAKALAARGAADRGDTKAALHHLDKLISELKSISGKKISAADAAKLTSEASAIENSLAAQEGKHS